MLSFFQCIILIPSVQEEYYKFEEYWQKQLKYIGEDYEQNVNEIFEQIIADYSQWGING